jgi:hypothetical protein
VRDGRARDERTTDGSERIGWGVWVAIAVAGRVVPASARRRRAVLGIRVDGANPVFFPTFLRRGIAHGDPPDGKSGF